MRKCSLGFGFIFFLILNCDFLSKENEYGSIIGYVFFQNNSNSNVNYETEPSG